MTDGHRLTRVERSTGHPLSIWFITPLAYIIVSRWQMATRHPTHFTQWMKPKVMSFTIMPFTVSSHALEKHLKKFFEGASVFKNKNTMMSSIRDCIDQPDCSSMYDERIYLEKHFNFTIGFFVYDVTASTRRPFWILCITYKGTCVSRQSGARFGSYCQSNERFFGRT